jgi:hypothetical protein
MNKYIPIRNLLKTPSVSLDELPGEIRDLFKGMKRDIIIILTHLLHVNKEIQNTIREKGGIPLILAQCNIDDDNPCTSLPSFSDE